MHIEDNGPGAAGPPPTSQDEHLAAARQLPGGAAVAEVAEAFRAGHLQLTADLELPGGWKIGPASDDDAKVLRVMLPESRGGFAIFRHDHPLAQRNGPVDCTPHSDKIPPEQQFAPFASPLADTFGPQVPLHERMDPSALKNRD